MVKKNKVYHYWWMLINTISNIKKNRNRIKGYLATSVYLIVIFTQQIYYKYREKL
jgi:uncharacterized membrane protein YecN with MAPEG domain